MKNTLLIIKFFLLFLIMLQSCSKQNDLNIIGSELILDNQYFVGRRTSDDLANIYTKEIIKGLFRNDTIRKYSLDIWTNIEFWDGDGGYLLFKDYNLADKNGLRFKIEALPKLNDNFLKSEDNRLKKEAEERFNSLNFDVTTVDEQRIWDFIQGDWHGWDFPFAGMEIYYKMKVSGRNIKIRRYVYIQGQSDRYSNWDNAPYEDFINCSLSGEISREITPMIIEGIVSTLKNEQKRAYLNFENNCKEDFRLYVSNPMKAYKDEEDEISVSFNALTTGWDAHFSRGYNFEK